ncbi:hypothetical protein I305_04946 [Cryptococcus gattii E566]|nr:hypothetical protein I305_04946 [Cryptococcus gattii E566]
MLEGKKNSMGLERWLAADLAGCLNSKRSSTQQKGKSSKVGNSTVDWQSKRQATASPSALEPEIRGQNVPLICDDMGAIPLASTPSPHSEAKYIDTPVHMIRDYVEYGYVSLPYI